jgi:hypothetical protein
MPCRTLCWPPNCRWLVTILPQGNVKLHFELFSTAFLMVVGGWGCGKYVEIDESCFSRRKCNLGQGVCNSMGLCWCGLGIGDTRLAPVADHFPETLLAIIKVCILPITTIVRDFCWYICLLNEGFTHHAVDCSIFVAQCSHKYNRGHVETHHHSPQALLRKQSKMYDK